MPRAKRADPPVEDVADEELDQTPEADTLSGAIPEGELALARSVASKMGWKPREEWTRDPDKFVDAPEYLEQTPRILANLKERSERTAQAAAAAIEEERRRKVDEATRVIRESDDPAEREQAAAKLRDNAGPPPETQAWLSRNPWFHTDPDAQALVRSTVDRLAAQGVPISAQLEEAEKKVRQRFPEYFSNGTEQRLSDVRRAAPLAPQVHQGSRAASQSAPKEKGWAEIPRLDREAFDRHMLKAYTSKGKTADEAHAMYADGYWRSPILPPDKREEDPWVNEKKSNPWHTRRRG